MHDFLISLDITGTIFLMWALTKLSSLDFTTSELALLQCLLKNVVPEYLSKA